MYLVYRENSLIKEMNQETLTERANENDCKSWDNLSSKTNSIVLDYNQEEKHSGVHTDINK